MSTKRSSIRIYNSFTLESWAEGRDLNPEPKFSRAVRPRDQGAACLCSPGVKPIQSEAKHDGPNGEASQTKGIIVPNGGVIKAPNRGEKIPTISFMSLKSILVANQEPSPEEGTGPQPDPMTTILEQDNQDINSRSLTNKKTPILGAIFLPLNQNTQKPQARLS
ncbi:hypothetical protein DSO57_1009873 [Entomophthora muscae]|uniref:Uncharacterized protein n=1 Tax=Entomophthora muscae TaxID=34485 RepID=A0ACC2SJL2_9FUNG|nr:hypothetical protein DSO57_1009873 [Entomophthora muscae]